MWTAAWTEGREASQERAPSSVTWGAGDTVCPSALRPCITDTAVRTPRFLSRGDVLSGGGHGP